MTTSRDERTHPAPPTPLTTANAADTQAGEAPVAPIPTPQAVQRRKTLLAAQLGINLIMLYLIAWGLPTGLDWYPLIGGSITCIVLHAILSRTAREQDPGLKHVAWYSIVASVVLSSVIVYYLRPPGFPISIISLRLVHIVGIDLALTNILTVAATLRAITRR